MYFLSFSENLVKKKDCIGIRGVEDLRRELRIGTVNEIMLKAAGIGRG